MVSSRPVRPVVGILWMLGAGLCFVVVTALVKWLGPGIPAAQSAFIRYMLGLAFLLPLLRSIRATPMNRRLWTMFGVRGVLHGIGVMLWFFAMTRISIAEVTALNYLAPIYVTIGAALFLGEGLAFRRISAVVVALIGAIIILRPGVQEVGQGHLAMIVAGLVFGIAYLLGKITTDESSPEMVLAQLSLWVTLTLAPFALAVWVPVPWSTVSTLFVVAFVATSGHYMMSLAFAAAPVTATQPVTYLQLVWATALGVLVFAEPIDIWVLVGGGLILGAVTFITWREAVLKRRSITPPPPAMRL
ncbi:MAG: DMT family transporter [Marinibacterium sp.]|nr:DMT family transporter [Marinibacterium sp.]